MKALLRVALITALSNVSCLAQTGTVTFYTLGNSVKSEAAGALPRSQQPFAGWLFDGPQRLVHVRPGRFMTFHFSPGAHTFTAPYHSNRPGKDELVISVVSGGQYCVKLYAKMTNLEILPFQWLDSQMKEVPCQQAQREATHLKPIEIKRVDPPARAKLDLATAFPGESRTQH